MIHHLKTRLGDSLRHSKLVRELAAHALSFAGVCSREKKRRLQHTTHALELTEGRILRSRLVRRLHQAGAFDLENVWIEIARSSPRYQTQFKQKMTLGRSIVLKGHGPGGEKGALLMTFEYNWARLYLGLTHEERIWFDGHYNVVLSTSWSPTDYAMLCLALACTRSQVFVQSCNLSECAAIEALHPRLSCLRTMPCDWIDADGFPAMSKKEREIDLLMVANWGSFKRHWEFFHTLSQMKPDLKVVLIGQKSEGRDKNYILQLAQHLGVKQKLEIHESLPIDRVAEIQSDSKVSVIMTRREGCCVAAVESLMAGCALAMREDAHVGPVAYINERTGMRLRPGHLAEDLQSLLDKAERLAPRNWCIDNALNTRSHHLLNEQLKAYELSLGHPWSRDIVLPRWRPHPTFAKDDEQQMMKPVYDELHERFPQVFADDLIENSWK